MKKICYKIQLFVLLIGIFLILDIPVKAAGWNILEKSPEFRKDIQWLNVTEPVKLRNLKGKYVLIHFWNASSPQCLNDLPELKQWSQKYSDRVTVLGIYAPRFTAERSIQNVQDAILRYDIEYPVANDPDLLIWRDFHVSLWPTLMLLDPSGKIIIVGSGKSFNQQVAKILEKNQIITKGGFNQSAVKISLERDKELFQNLRFPTRILADPIQDRLFISDTGNHRIIISDLAGHVFDVIGNGKSGSANGNFTEAVFDQPQGMALRDEYLYVADSGIHRIRKVDLKNRNVSTIAGTGENNNSNNLFGDALQVQLDSPVDLTIASEHLYIANAGSHQILDLSLNDNKIRVFAGTGQPGIVDGPLRMSSLAQPSGLSSDGKNIYFTDSLVSAVRSAEIIPSGYIRTVMGYNFFVFGDRDGDRGWTRLQYPNGILYLPDALLVVADTYNNKIKLIDMVKLITKTLSGNGQIGQSDGGPETASFNQPHGLAFKQNKIYVADTNNHAIRIIDLQDRKVSTLALKFTNEGSNEQAIKTVDLKGEKVAPPQICSDHISKIKLRITLPPEHKFLSEGMNLLTLYSGSGNIIKSFKFKDLNSDLTLTNTPLNGRAYAQVTLYYCQEGNKGMCKVKTILFDIQAVKNRGQSACVLNYTVLP